MKINEHLGHRKVSGWHHRRFPGLCHYNAGHERREYQLKSAINHLDWKEGQA
jgi:hypothetical protein